MAQWTDSFSSGGATLILNVSESGTSAATNKGTISWSLQIRKDKAYQSYNNGGASISVTIGGTKRWSSDTFDIRSLSVGSKKTLKSGEFTATHASDGTLSLSCSASFKSGVSLGTASISSKTFTGTTIPRKSTLTVANGTLGTAQTLTVNEKASAFYHKLSYTCGSASSYILGSASGTSGTLSTSWTPPLTLAQQNKTGTSVSVKFTLATYTSSSGSLVGSEPYTRTFSIPSSVAPTCSVAISDPTGYATKYGAYVKGKSKIRVVTTPSTTNAQGATISSYSVSANGASYTKADITTGVVASTGTLTVKSTVKDSRGRTASASKTLTAVAYTAPTITALSAKRSADGNSLIVTFSGSVTSLNSKNSAKYTLQYKKATDTDYTSVTLDDYTGNYSVKNGTYTFTADPTSSYSLILTASDDFGNGTPKTGNGSTAKVLFSILQKGLGWAFGKIAEFENTLDIAFDTLIRTHLTFINGSEGINFENSSGVARNVVKMTGNDLKVGYDSYAQKEGSVAYLGNAIHLYSNSGINITSPTAGLTGRTYGVNKVLWSGCSLMGSDESYTLSEKISAQPHGIILCWSAYNGGSGSNQNWNYTFIPKSHATNAASGGVDCIISSVATIYHKYVYVADTKITGYAKNSNTAGSWNGGTYDMTYHALRYVIGV